MSTRERVIELVQAERLTAIDAGDSYTPTAESVVFGLDAPRREWLLTGRVEPIGGVNRDDMGRPGRTFIMVLRRTYRRQSDTYHAALVRWTVHAATPASPQYPEATPARDYLRVIAVDDTGHDTPETVRLLD